MTHAIKIALIGAGSTQFSLSLVKDLCLTEALSSSNVSLMDIATDRLEIVHDLSVRYAQQLGSAITFEKTLSLDAALAEADFVVNTSFALGHTVEAQVRHRAAEQHGYFYFGGHFGNYHQLCLMLDIAETMKRICPNAWLIQLSNPVFEGCTLITRETGIKVIGLCQGHYGYREIATTIGLDPDHVTWQASGINHNIWLTHFIYEGKDAYPLIDQWIEAQGEEYWTQHVANKSHDVQMSRSAVHQYHMYGLFPIGDTTRRGGWWYHTDIETKKAWFGEPWGGPDTPSGRAHFLAGLEERIQIVRKWAGDSKANLVSLIGTERTREQTIPIIDALVNNHEGRFQVNVPNGGTIQGIPDDVVVEVPAIVSQKGVQPLHVDSLPPKIMLERILPDWLEMERGLLAFQTGDKSILLYNVLEHRQTRSYEQALIALDDLLHLDTVIGVEDREKIMRSSDYFQYPARF